MTVLVALLLAGMFTLLKPTHEKNEALFNKKAILAAMEPYLDKKVKDMSDEEVLDIFKSRIKQNVIDHEGNTVEASAVAAMGYDDGQAEDIEMKKEKKKADEDRVFPVFTYTGEDGKKFYIVSVRGNGLWDEIWGNIAISEDLTTIGGASFDHQGETPGLGAEIKDNAGFRKMFEGKKLFSEDGEYTSVLVRKGGAKNDRNEVDGISGATITADGVTDMLYKGINYYRPYFDKIKKN